MTTNFGSKIADGTPTSGDKFASTHGFGSVPFLQRAVVHDILVDPASLTDDRIDELRSKVRYTKDIRNLPRNTVLGERIRTGHTEINGLEFFFPFLPPHMALPVKPGEQVWVVFEDPSMVDTQGFYTWRISEARAVDDVNHTHADRKFDRRAPKTTADKAAGGPPPVPGFENGGVGLLDGEDVNLKGTGSIAGGKDAYKKILTGPDAASGTKVHDYEAVPRFTKRPGDAVLQGSNNAVLVLGTDRSGPATKVKEGLPDSLPDGDQSGEAGTAILSVGRGRKPKTSGKKIKNALGRQEIDKTVDSKEDPAEGNFDFENDSATIVVSMKTSADKNFSIKHGNLKDTSKGVASAAVVKADQVRLVARQDVKLIVKASESTPDSEAAMFVIKLNGDIVLIPSEKGVIKLGGDDADMALLGTHAGVTNNNGKVSASPIIDSMGGAQGGSDGLNGVFATKILGK